MIRKIIYIGFFIVLVALVLQIYRISEGRRVLVNEMATVSDELELISADNTKLNEQIKYFSDPRNLEKELRSRFNYRLPYEKLIIVVPEE